MLYTLGAMFSFVLQNLGMKEFSRRFPEGMTGSYIISCLATLVGGIILALFGNLYVESVPILLGSMGYGVLYALGLMLSTVAVATGPLNIAVLFANVSMVIPVVFGLFFWGETLSVLGAIGVALTFVVLVLGSSGKQEGGSRPMTTKWKIVVFSSFTVNGLASIYRYYFTGFFPNASSGAFTCWACLVSSALLALILLFNRLKGRDLKPWLGKNQAVKLGVIAAATGVGIAFGNLLTLTAVTVLPSVILYPVMQGGQIPVLWLFSVLLYKEKVNSRSLTALILGLVSIVLLNL